MRADVSILATIFLLAFLPSTAVAAPCVGVPQCVDHALEETQDAVESVVELLECTTEAFGCIPPPARDVLTCLTYGYGCSTVHSLVAAAQEAACDVVGCDA